MAEFILERINYWAIIGLMMIGLYIVFQSNNLVKRLVGLSVFQTSIFLFYITLGKVAGGSAPILYGRDYPKSYGDKHGGGHGAPHAGGHGAEDHGSDTHDAPDQTGGAAPSGETPPHGDDAAPIDASEAIETAYSAGASGFEPLKEVYSNPLPHVLILTAIVVGVATLSVGLAIVVRIREAYGTIESDEIRDADRGVAAAQIEDDKDTETAGSA